MRGRQPFVRRALDRVGTYSASAALALAVRVLRTGCSVRGGRRALVQLEEIRRRWPGRRLLIYFWVSDVPLLLVLLQASEGALASEFVSVCGSSVVGRSVEAMLRRYGRKSIPLHLSGAWANLDDLRRIIREPAPLFISADGSGPFGRVHQGLGRLVRSRGDLATPVSLCVSRPLRLNQGAWRADLAVSLGPPVELVGLDDQEDLTAGLNACRESCRQMLSADTFR